MISNNFLGIIVSKRYSDHPPRYEYELTQDGSEVKDVLFGISIWGNNHFEEKYNRIVDPTCGHEVQIGYVCPQCEHYTNKPKLKAI